MLKTQISPKSKKHWFGIRRRWLALAILSFWLVITLWQAPIVHSRKVNSDRIHGVWMTNYGAALSYYTTRLDEVVANIAKHNLNTIYPAVWNRGYTLYPSPVAKRVIGAKQHHLTSLPLLPYQDALLELVKQSHRQHLRIIPWFEYGLMVQSNHVITKRHPEWLTVTQSGEKVSNDGMSWLNPCHPEVQQFITDLIVDVVKRYDIDGIQLDDHFALPVEFGYDGYTVQLYRDEHNGIAPPKNAKNPEWMAWRAAKLTNLMSKISKAVKAEKQNVIVSLSPNSIDFAYRKYLQDWRKWVNDGLLDEVIVQVYRDNVTAIASELNNADLLNIRKKIPIAIGLYTGPFLKAKSISKLQKEVETVEKAKYQGVSFFCWETTLWLFKGGSENQVKKTFQQFF